MMKKDNISYYFQRSQTAGIVYELVSYIFILLCGYLLSNLLECTMESRWQQMYQTGLITTVMLGVSILPKYALTVWKSQQRLSDTQKLREFLYQGVLNRSVCVEDRGEMNVRMNSDVKTISKYFQDTLPKAISGSSTLICSTILICIVDWRIGLIFFVLNLTQLIPIVVYEKWARQIYNQTHSDEEAYCDWMLEGYNGIRTIKAYGVERWFMDRYYRLNEAIVRSGRRAEQVGTVESIIFDAISSLLNYGSYLIIGLFILDGELTIDKAPLLIILSGYLFSSISSVFDMRLQQFDYQEAKNRLSFKEAPAIRNDGNTVLKAERISKAYGDKRVLIEASCEICPGDRVLFRGENGGGKSTLLRILAGLEEADGGNVIRGVQHSDMVLSLQEEPELNISGNELISALKENGRADMAALIRHLEAFRVSDLLEKPLSELSPGERKKFYLSTALAHCGELLILDEPTNHIDQSSVQYLKEQLDAYTGTLIVCTHASALNLGWNKIILVEGGACHESEY